MTDRDRADSRQGPRHPPGSFVCQGPYGAEGDPGDCFDPARFEVARHRRPPLRVCPVHLGPALLLATGVLWPPGVSLIR